MYPQPKFQERDSAAIWDFVRKFPFAMLSTVAESGRIEATHVPLLVRNDGGRVTLRGHVMRKTPHWYAFESNPDVLAAFTGPDAPIIASWNEDPVFGGTWNYMSVHARGQLRFLAEPDLIEILRELKDMYEVDPAAKFDRLPPDYVPSLIKAVEGFEIQVSDVEAVFKLSQNRSRVDFERTIAGLRLRSGESELVAEEMEARRMAFYSS